jgi:hypothetical protein
MTTKHVRFASRNNEWLYRQQDHPVMIIYDSGADSHYLCERNCIQAGLPILRSSNWKVGVANGGTSKAQHVSQLPFNKLLQWARHPDTFTDFPTSLMSVGKTSDDGTISVFDKSGTTVHREEDVLITGGCSHHVQG